jgi:cytochrome o ubiquinol oxidase subunit 1
MGMMKMPIFTWTALCTNILIVASFPVLTAVLAPAVHGPLLGHRLFFERLWRQLDDVRQPDLDLGPPEVYIRSCRCSCSLKLTFQRQAPVRLCVHGVRHAGDHHLVSCRVAAPLLHHGLGASVNAFFGITTMIISIPTGAKIFNWLFTMYGPHPLRAHAGRSASWSPSPSAG